MKVFFVFLGLIFLQACSTAPVAYNQSKREGQWEAKAQLKDLKNSSANTLSLEVMAVKDRALRIEVSGTMGVQVASILMRENKINYLIHTQKKAYFGEVTESALQPVLKMNINPRWLYAMFFDEPLEGWQCTGNPVEKCSRADGMSMIWNEREGEKKRMILSSEQFQLQILVKNYLTKVQDPDKAFKLTVPDSYKKYKLN